MFLPSERLSKEMNAEAASIWYVLARGNSDVAILVKSPSSTIKAIIAGCKTVLMFGKKVINGKTYFCTGVKVFDTPDAPIFIFGAQRESEEHEALANILQVRRAPVYLFNEMDVCLAWCYAEFLESDTRKAISFFGPLDSLYVGPFSREASHCLDCFCFSVDSTQGYEGADQIETIELSPELSGWKALSTSFFGNNEIHTFSIDHENEGEMFEKVIWSSLESVFPLTLYKSPKVITGDRKRELTDVFSFYRYGSFLIEAKDLSVIKAGYDRTQERKIKGIQKQVKKAIAQLVGAAKSLYKNDRVFTAKGEELYFDRDKTPHCIVLITELIHSGDWSEIEIKLMEAMRETGAFFNLLDLRELIGLLKACSGKAELLDYNLVERCKLFARMKTVHLRSRPISHSSLQET